MKNSTLAKVGGLLSILFSCPSFAEYPVDQILCDTFIALGIQDMTVVGENVNDPFMIESGHYRNEMGLQRGFTNSIHDLGINVCGFPLQKTVKRNLTPIARAL